MNVKRDFPTDDNIGVLDESGNIIKENLLKATEYILNQQYAQCLYGNENFGINCVNEVNEQLINHSLENAIRT